jgi:hypothetical protein
MMVPPPSYITSPHSRRLIDKLHEVLNSASAIKIIAIHAAEWWNPGKQGPYGQSSFWQKGQSFTVKSSSSSYRRSFIYLLRFDHS